MMTPEIREQVQAARRRLTEPKITEAERERFRDAVHDVYNSIGPDSGWIDKTPSKAVFFDVMCDHIDGPHGRLSQDEISKFRSLSVAEKKRIVFSVGP